jgi:integrase
MAKKVISSGVYQDAVDKSFWVRPWIDGRRTWRKLEATKLRYAIEEAATKKVDHSRSKLGVAKSPYAAPAGMFKALAAAYVSAGCPNKRLEPRDGTFSKNEQFRLVSLLIFFGNRQSASIRIPLLTEYAAWRKPRFKKANCSGNRSIDMELCTLSNVLTYGVMIGELEYNPIAIGKPRFQTAAKIRRSRERAAGSGDDVHRLADFFFNSPRPKTEVMAWMTIFSALTGCRHIELRRLRMDGKGPETPGWISGNYLFLARAKKGVHPYIEIKDELAAAIDCFRNWHDERYPESPWWFPGQDKTEQLSAGAFCYALDRACKALGMPKCSPHGFRAFYVTKRRSEGIMDAQIASEIGDRTVAVIAESYGDRPPNWTGQEKLSFLPKEGLPAWERWREKERKIVSL